MHIVSLRFLSETVDYIKGWLRGRRVFAIAAQAILGELQMTLRNRNLVRMFGNLIPKRLEITDQIRAAR